MYRATQQPAISRASPYGAGARPLPYGSAATQRASSYGAIRPVSRAYGAAGTAATGMSRLTPGRVGLGVARPVTTTTYKRVGAITPAPARPNPTLPKGKAPVKKKIEVADEVEEEAPPEEEVDPELEGVEEEALEEPVEEELVEEEPVEEEPVEEAEEEPVVDDDEDGAPKREDDLSLDEVPEDHREAVEGQLRLKRILSSADVKDGSAAKKAKVGEDKPLDAFRQGLLTRFGLTMDSSAKYVLGATDIAELEDLKKAMWSPNRIDNQKSAAEQINEWILKNREKKLPPGSELDVVAAFKYRWKLPESEVQLLRKLNHKDLRFCMKEYDGSRPIAEICEEASMQIPEDNSTDDAAPEKPGVLTLSRFNRLELIDPVADSLVCGDANLTFSLCLAKHRKALGHVGRIVATTFEQIDTLRERYKEIDQTVEILEEHCAEVLHNVDCTRLAVDPRFQGMHEKFGAVYYNFPHAGVCAGFFDGHPFVRWRHENLMHLFFRALRAFVKPSGSVKVSSNSNARGVRYSDIILAATSNEFVHVETMPFLEWNLRNYGRSYGDRRDVTRRPKDGEIYNNQGQHSDMVYAFRYDPTGESLSKPSIRYPPTKDCLMKAQECSLRGLTGESRKKKVEEMYNLFLSYVQGIHIG